MGCARDARASGGGTPGARARVCTCVYVCECAPPRVTRPTPPQSPGPAQGPAPRALLVHTPRRVAAPAHRLHAARYAVAVLAEPAAGGAGRRGPSMSPAGSAAAPATAWPRAEPPSPAPPAGPALRAPGWGPRSRAHPAPRALSLSPRGARGPPTAGLLPASALRLPRGGHAVPAGKTPPQGRPVLAPHDRWTLPLILQAPERGLPKVTSSWVAELTRPDGPLQRVPEGLGRRRHSGPACDDREKRELRGGR